ncbi:thioredoxin family protein [Nocardia arthritidis]|uniref:Thioredoxin n=1 Tax=Nocardia arthritidis TaxID=228602 RepID=A0A6G9YAD6_9NOCA|nr:thioredoxin domain-containing protein [Nocardia arthritidis]QIS10080.1 thiol reductase thioredoxin [Nocardia arthritidis]
MSIAFTTDPSFEEDVLNAPVITLVMFRTSWSNPCKVVEPVLEDIRTQYGNQLGVFKLDVDDNQATPAKFNVRGLPAFLLFRDGAVESEKTGPQSKSQLMAWIDSHL